MPIKNVMCCSCEAMCQESEVVPIVIRAPLRGFKAYPWVEFITVHLCGFCEIDPEQPIPFTVTEKGKAESMRQPAKEEPNA